MKISKLLFLLIIGFLAFNSCNKDAQSEARADAYNAQSRRFSVVSDDLMFYHKEKNNLYIKDFLLNEKLCIVEASALSPEPSPSIFEWWIRVDDWIRGINSPINCSFTVIEGVYDTQTIKSYSGTILETQLPGNKLNIFRIVRNDSRKTNSGWKLLLNEQNIDLAEDGNNGSGNETYCFVGGTWKKTDCEGAIYNLAFNENKTGYMSYTGCTFWEIKSSRYEFNWSESNGSITYTYTHCEKPIGTTIANLNGGSQSYTCTSDSFTTGGDTWTK